jgi:hypothetical protein
VGFHPAPVPLLGPSQQPQPLGGLVGIVGLILAVPATVIASNGIARLRARGSLARVAERAEPTVRCLLS